MPNKSKAKGNRVERIIVDLLQAAGWTATRAWGSNGRAIGKHEEVDIAAFMPNGTPLDIQVKSRKKLPDYIRPPEACDLTVLKEDRQEPYVVISLEKFIALTDADDEQ